MVDPSKVEALVMGQVARRKSEHEARNQAAKLTPQEKRDKKKRKLLEDTSKELQVFGRHISIRLTWIFVFLCFVFFFGRGGVFFGSGVVVVQFCLPFWVTSCVVDGVIGVACFAGGLLTPGLLRLVPSLPQIGLSPFPVCYQAPAWY